MSSRATSRVTKLECFRLGSQQSGWNLIGTNGSPPLGRTRGGGNGRSNLHTAVGIDAESSDDAEDEEEWDVDYEDEDSEDSDEYEEFEKPPAHRPVYSLSMMRRRSSLRRTAAAAIATAE